MAYREKGQKVKVNKIKTTFGLLDQQLPVGNIEVEQ